MNSKQLYLSMMYIAEADGVICKSEKEMIERLCGIDDYCVDSIKISDIPFESKADSIDALISCVRLSLIDGHYDSEERKRFYQLAEHFRIHEREAKAIEEEEKKMKWLSSGTAINMD